MKTLLLYMRFAQLFTHNAHNFTSKPTFFSDHDFFGDAYGKFEGYYDAIAERMIGLGEEFDPVSVQVEAAGLLNDVKIKFDNNDACFQLLLNITKEILALIEKLCKTGNLSQGTLQLIGGQADELEGLVYKLKRRLKG